VAVSTCSKTPILRYVPKLRRKEGESPFTGVVNRDAEGKKANEVGMSSLKESATLLIRKEYQPSVNKYPLPGFVSSSNVLLKSDDDLLHTRTKEGCDPNVYKLMERAGYDFQT